MEFVINLIIFVVALAAGFGAGYYYYRNITDKKIKSAEARAQEIVTTAEGTGKELVVQAKEEAQGSDRKR